MPQPNAITTRTPIRLPPLSKLRPKRAVQKSQMHHCASIMSTMLSCWAAASAGGGSCVHLEQELRKCTDGPKPPAPPKTALNYHLARLYPNIKTDKKYR